MVRLRFTINKEAQESLMSLQRRMKKNTSEIVNDLLIMQSRTMEDDELFQIEYFSSCVIYKTQLPFCFVYECEEFNITIKNRNVRLYLERVPKRYVINRLPFITLVTIIIELDEIKDFPKNINQGQLRKKVQKNTEKFAFNLLKKTIIRYRRITQNYYNIGPIKPPINLEVFIKNSSLSIIRDGQIFDTWRLMPVTEGSSIAIIKKLDPDIHSQIMDYLNKEDVDEPIPNPLDFFDQSMISYLEEEWNLCLIHGVIAMESALSHLVFDSVATPLYILKRGSKKALREWYRDAMSLPKKIERFLFPVIIENKIIDSNISLKRIFPLMYNKKLKTGLYELRSKIIHEGVSVSKIEADLTIEIVPQFFKILDSVVKSF